MIMNRYDVGYTANSKTTDVPLSYKEKLYSFIVACFLSIALIERVIVYFTNQSYVLFYIAIILFVFILITGSKTLRINIVHIVMFVPIVFVGIISVAFNGASAIRYLEYCACFFLPAVLIFSRRSIHYEQTLKYINIINFGYLIFYILLYHSYLMSSFNYASLQMEAGYNFVPCVLYAVITIKYLKPKAIQVILCLANSLLSIIYMFLDNASRGPLVLILFFLLVIYIREQKNIKKIVAVVFVFIITMILLENYENILIWINGVLSSFGISMPLLDKLILWSRTNYSVLNGRNILYSSTFEFIKKSPFIGSGIGCFEKYYYSDNLSYVHQYFLQVACEFGLIGFIGAVIIFLKQLKIILSKKYLLANNISELDVGFGIVFFSLSMPRLMFSSSYWLTGSFWLLLAWSLPKINFSLSGIKIKH